MNRPRWFRLGGPEGRTPEPCSLEEGARFLEEDGPRIIGQAEFARMRVSTVFLCLDHAHREGLPPILFETKVWRDGVVVETKRYSTWDEAERGHAASLEWVRAGREGEGSR